MLDLKPAFTEQDHYANIAPAITEMFALCELNEDVILTHDTVTRLNQLREYHVVTVPPNVTISSGNSTNATRDPMNALSSATTVAVESSDVTTEDQSVTETEL